MIRLILKILLVPVLFPSLMKLYYKVYSLALLSILGVYSFPYKFKVHNKMDKKPKIILSSQSSIIEWLVLMYNYQPKFLYIRKSLTNKSDYFMELSFLNIIFYGIGNKFPKEGKLFDFEYFLKNSNEQVVIFPENTKTNRLGILNIRSNLMDTIYKNILEDKIVVRAEIINNNSNICNTTSFLGLGALFKLLCNFTISIDIYSQDIRNQSFKEEELEIDRSKYPQNNLFYDYMIQELLMNPINRNVVKFNSLDHEKFIKYYNKTHSSRNYVNKKY